MDLVANIEYIFSLFTDENAYDKIPSDFDFKHNKYAIEIKIGSSITDLDTVNEVPLQIRIVGLDINKLDILNKAKDIDLMINNKQFNNNNWIIRSNPYINTYDDEDKYNVVLIYYINNYKERND